MLSLSWWFPCLACSFMLRVASSLVVPPLPSCGLAPCMGLWIGLEATDHKIIVLRYSRTFHIRSIKFVSVDRSSFVFGKCIVNITQSFGPDYIVNSNRLFPFGCLPPTWLFRWVESVFPVNAKLSRGEYRFREDFERTQYSVPAGVAPHTRSSCYSCNVLTCFTQVKSLNHDQYRRARSACY